MTTPTPKPSVRVIEELRNLHERQAAAWKEYLLCKQCSIHDGAEKALAEFRETRDAVKDAAFDVLPALLAVVEIAKRRSDWYREHGEGASVEEAMDKDLDFDIEMEEALSALDATGGGL